MKKLDTEHGVTISPSIVVFTVLFLIGLYFLYFIHQILVALFLAVILMSALNPALKWMEKRLRIPKILGIFILYISMILSIGLAILLIVPPLVNEIPNFISTLSLPPIPEDIRHFNFTVAQLSSFFTQIGSLGALFSVITSAFSGVFGFFTILVMSCYLLIDRENLHKKIVWFSPEKKHLELAKEFVDRIEIEMGGWVRGQLFLMVTIGVVTYIGMMVLGIPYPVPLGLAAGLLEVLPNLGPTLAAIPGIAVAYGAYGPGMAGFVALFYVIVQQLENHFIVPKIMKDSVDVSPLTTILTILIGFKISGVIGALLAVPVYIMIRTLYSIWLREKNSL
jgi:predicted PurR-regulated permease PerM